VQTTNTGAFVPFIAAFGVIGLVMSVLIISTVVSGSVGSATWRIGVLKSLGLIPAQVVRAYVAQAWIPAGAGTLIGIAVGNLLAIPVLKGADNTYGAVGSSIPLWVNVVVPLAALLLVGCAAFAPALRAGRMRASEAIAIGRTPKAGRARSVQHWAGRLRLPRAITLGLATPFGRPARSSALAAAVVFGTASVAFATGLALSLNGVQQGRQLDSAGAVTINTAAYPDVNGKSITVRPGQDGTRKPADPAAVAAIIKSASGTKSYYGTVDAQVQVGGISGLSHAIAYTGDSSWATHQMVSGHWLDGPGEAVASPRFLTAAGLQVGDSVTVSNAGKSTSVRIVGSEFELSNDGMDLLTDASTFSALGIAQTGIQYQVELQSDTSVSQYLDAVNQQLRPINADAEPVFRDRSSVIVAMDALVALLTIMMVVVAALGVLNTVVLETRERVHDLGVLKALGMSPRQTITTVITSATTVGVIGGLIGVPVGVAVHSYVLPIMGHIAGTTLPKVDLDVYSAGVLALLALGGVVIAVVGALLPAGWAAKIRTASALRTE
jgi:putative ABC transport system permease protein